MSYLKPLASPIFVPRGALACDVRTPDKAGKCAPDALDLDRETLLKIAQAKVSGTAARARGDNTTAAAHYAEADRILTDGLSKLAVTRGRKDHDDMCDTNRKNDALEQLAKLGIPASTITSNGQRLDTRSEVYLVERARLAADHGASATAPAKRVDDLSDRIAELHVDELTGPASAATLEARRDMIERNRGGKTDTEAPVDARAEMIKANRKGGR